LKKTVVLVIETHPLVDRVGQRRMEKTAMDCSAPLIHHLRSLLLGIGQNDGRVLGLKSQGNPFDML
jgi:hypothetical protein